MNDDLLFRRNALSKRRAELLEEIASCADDIKKIDDELEKSHCLDGVDPDGVI